MIAQYRKMAYDTHKIAQGLSPYRTGNLRHNAIFLRNFRLTKDGAEWRINYSSRNARYIDPLNYGWQTSKGKVEGRYFIQSAVLAISRYVRGAMTNKELGGLKTRVNKTQEFNLNNEQKELRKMEFYRNLKLDRMGVLKPDYEARDYNVSRG